MSSTPTNFKKHSIESTIFAWLSPSSTIDIDNFPNEGKMYCTMSMVRFQAWEFFIIILHNYPALLMKSTPRSLIEQKGYVDIFMLYLPSGRAAWEAKLPRYSVTKLQSSPITKLLSYSVTQLLNYPVTKLPSYPVTQLPSYLITLLSSYQVIQLPSYPVTITQLPSYSLTSYPVTQLPRYSVTQLPGYLVTVHRIYHVISWT